jgi:hypothetical protein
MTMPLRRHESKKSTSLSHMYKFRGFMKWLIVLFCCCCFLSYSPSLHVAKVKFARDRLLFTYTLSPASVARMEVQV